MADLVSVTVTRDDVTGHLAAAAAAGRNLRPMMVAIGGAWVARASDAFDRSRSPYNEPWAPILHRIGKPLLDTGRLRRSISARPASTELVVGTNVVYARIHNEGGTIERSPYSTKVRLRRVKGRVQFAKDSHKRATTSWHAVGAFRINMPTRTFLPTRGLPAGWQDDVYKAFLTHMAPAGVKP